MSFFRSSNSDLSHYVTTLKLSSYLFDNYVYRHLLDCLDDSLLPEGIFLFRLYNATNIIANPYTECAITITVQRI
jgi:hypothetical protein